MANSVIKNDMRGNAVYGNRDDEAFNLKIDTIAFDSNRSNGYTFSYTNAAVLIIFRDTARAMYLFDKFGGIQKAFNNNDGNISVSVSNKTVTVTIATASFHFGICAYF